MSECRWFIGGRSRVVVSGGGSNSNTLFWKEFGGLRKVHKPINIRKVPKQIIERIRLKIHM